MKFFAINGSHRKDGNTAQLLEKALEGIKSVCSDAEIESVNLYDVPFKSNIMFLIMYLFVFFE